MATEMLLNMTGCDDVLQARSNLAEELLQEKYGITFTVYGQRQKEVADLSEYIITAYPDYDENIRFEASVHREGLYIHDNFISKKISCDLEKIIGENCGRVFSECEVIVTSAVKRGEPAPANITVEEYVQKNPKNRYAIYIVADLEKLLNMPPEVLYDEIEKILKELPEISGSIEFFFAYGELLTEVKAYKRQMLRVDARFEDILEDVKSIRMMYEKNNLTMTKEQFMQEYYREG